MSNEKTTTTTTTEDPETTTTTTVGEQGTGTTEAPETEKQGEVAVDSDAKAPVLGGEHSGPEADAKAQEENLENAKRDGLKNAQGDQDLYA